MNQYSFIKFPENITSFEIYHNVLQQLNLHFSSTPSSRIIFDFSNVEYINPLVLPNLFICGQQIKKFYNEPVQLLIPWKPKLLGYLNDTCFFGINTKTNTFLIDERVLGDFESTGLNESRLYHFSNQDGLDKGDISLILKKSLPVIEKAFRDTLSINENKIDKILIIFEELVWNALVHGKGDCFACFQSNLGRNTHYKKAFISFSDDGIGFLKSLQSKDFFSWTTKFLHKVPDQEDTYRQLAAILEAVFYRLDKEAFGIYDVLRLALNEKGTVRIHNINTQVVLTPHSLPVQMDQNEIFQHFVNLHIEGARKDPKYSSVRIGKEKLQGIHYEFEIPLELEG